MILPFDPLGTRALSPYLKDMPLVQGVVATALGFVFFGGVKTGAMNLTGITMNTFGAAWYSVAKYKQRAAEESAAKSKETQ